jgi:hypothetical protein
LDFDLAFPLRFTHLPFLARLCFFPHFLTTDAGAAGV